MSTKKNKSIKIKKSKSIKNKSLKVKKTKKEKVTAPVKEYEAKFLDIDYDELITKLKSLGAIRKTPNMIFRRSVFNLCDVKRGYVRVRDEGNKVTMTSKIYKDPKFPDEYEVDIKDTFEKGQAFLKSLNLNEKAYHETMRETWRLPYGKNPELCELAIDCIPGLPMYVEVECKTEKDLNKSIKMLKLGKHKMMFGAYGKVFNEYYGISQLIMDNDVASLTFKNIENELKPYIKSNENLLKEVANKHMETYKKLV
jgi:adenylate cyclase class IV